MLLWSLQVRDRTADRMSYQEHAMSTRLIARVPAAAVAACLFMSAAPALAQMAPPALIGKVTSDREGAMEGVLVRAKKPAGKITVTVASDANGDYAFTVDRLEGGRYELTIRAAGYALQAPTIVELAPGQATRADLRLKSSPVTTDQLTNSEWMASVPGPEDLKRALLNCADCHSLRRIFESKHTATDFLKVFERMSGYYPGASDLQPQRLVGEHRRPHVNPAIAEKLAEYLASVNLSRQSAHDFAPRIAPRPAGRATRGSSSRNTIFRGRKSSHTTSSSISTAWSGTRISANSSCPSSTRRPGK